MPAYQNLTPPYALFSGDVGFSFNNEAFPAANTAGSQFALPSFTGISDGGTALRWTLVYGTAPTAVSIRLEAAMTSILNIRPLTRRRERSRANRALSLESRRVSFVLNWCPPPVVRG